MAKLTLTPYSRGTKKTRPGIHSKCKTSKLKQSKNYRKAYRVQGR